MSDSYTTAALRGFGDETYTTAALRGFGDESYTTAALRGFGDESYNEAAIKGFGCDCGDTSYTNAALRGFGKRTRKAVRTKRGGKRMKGGIAISTILTIASALPTVIGAANEIYKQVKQAVNERRKGTLLTPKQGGEYIFHHLPGKYPDRILSKFPKRKKIGENKPDTKAIFRKRINEVKNRIESSDDTENKKRWNVIKKNVIERFGSDIFD